jgi:hypothetical protein
VKAKALKQLLTAAANSAPDAAPPRIVPPALVMMLPLVNTGVALGVVFDMVTKPASVPVALGVIAIGIATSAALAWRKRPDERILTKLPLRQSQGQLSRQSSSLFH